MAGFRFDVFKGIRPRLRSRLLPEGEAQIAQDLRLGSGALEPWSANVVDQAESVVGVQSIYRIRNNGTPQWLESINDVDYAPGPVADDVLERIYYTGEAEPRMSYLGIMNGAAPRPTDYRILGIPAPDAAPTLTGDAVPDVIVDGTTDSGGFQTNVLKADFSINQNLPFDLNDWRLALTNGGVISDNGYEPNGTTRAYAFNFGIGKELRVVAVPDANTVTLSDANSGNFVAAGVDDEADAINWWRTDDGGTTRAGFFRFYLPNSIDVGITGHNLQVDDVIRVAAVPEPVSITFTQDGTGLLYGAESDNGLGTAGSNTWPAAPVSVGTDAFYTTGSGYPFVDAWAGPTGPAHVTDFDIDGSFSYQLIERNGESYATTVADIETRIYVYTYVSFLGEEGPPSAPSASITIPSDGEVVVTMTGTPPTVQRDIDFWRVYRSNTGNEITEFQFIDEIAIGTTTYADNILDTDLGEILQTETWEPPPTGLTGVVAGANGILAGFVGKTFHMCEPYFPHAWPPEYKQAVEHDIVGIGVLPNGFAILTKGPPYSVLGDHPRGMSLNRYEFSQACVSKRSIVNTLDSVLYASPDGLAEIGGSKGFSVVTRDLFTKREWQLQSPTEIIGNWHDSKYFGFTTSGGFVFDPEDESIGFTTLSLGTVEATFVDTEADILYVLDATNIETFDATPNNYTGAGAFTWQSGRVVAPYPINLGAARIIATSYPVTLNIWDDTGTNIVVNRSVTSDEAIRLPKGSLSDWFEIQVSNDDVVEMVHVAETVDELFQG